MPEIDQEELETGVHEILNRRPAVGLALGVVRDGDLEFFHGHGVADVETRVPVTVDTVFRVASITKTFTAIAVMQLWERGLVDLDAPANDYLRSFELVPAKTGWRPATLRHLLTHTAGVGEQVPRSSMFRRDFGESVRAGERVPSLAEYYRGAVRLDAEPGTRFRYGDHSPSTLGQIVEDLTGQPLEEYLRDRVFEPLGMADTTLVRSEVPSSHLATGYTLHSRGPRRVPERAWVTVGATNAWSTPRDMARYIAALLGGGRNDHGSVLEPATLAEMFAVQYRPHPRVPGMGLAFWRREAGGHPMVEHLGVIPGFDSLIVAAHDDGVGVMAFTNGTRGGPFWLAAELSGLMSRLLDVPEDTVRADVPQRPEVWADICGWYYLPGPLTDTRVRGAMGLGAEVFVRGGKLMLRFLTPIPALCRGFPLLADDGTDPYAFKIDLSGFGGGVFPVVFSRDRETGTMAVHFEVMPLSAYRRSDRENPRLWAEGAATLTAAAVLAGRRRALRRRRRAS